MVVIPQISRYIKESLQFTGEDSLIFNRRLFAVSQDRFAPLQAGSGRTITFIDGGQAEIISAGNFCLSFIRVFAQSFKDSQKTGSARNEFYLFTRARYLSEDLFYESIIFPCFPLDEKLVDENDLLISSNDSSIRRGSEGGPVGAVAGMARRFAELKLAAKADSDFIVLDGTLQPAFPNEEKYLSALGKNVCALAKTSSLLTVSGNSPAVLLNKLAALPGWSYFVDGRTYFVKLNEKARHVFRFEGDKEILPFLAGHCHDALFPGYPYGLILADKLARVSNSEKSSLKMSFLLREENREIGDYLNSTNAHEILDTLG